VKARVAGWHRPDLIADAMGKSGSNGFSRL
jgi:hypothetical protein